MIETSFNYEEYEKNRIASHKAQGLCFVPDGDGPKVYCVVCANASDWNEIHDYIINENEIDGIPNRKIECTNLKKTCNRIASYMISDAEAEQLKTHPKVIGVNLDEGYYEGTFKGRNVFVDSEPPNKTARYSADVRIAKDTSGNGFNGGNSGGWLRKTAAQIYRHQTFDNPWKNSSSSTLLTDTPEQFGDGTDVDLIVCDSASWFGHIEFIKTGIGEPTNFVGTNPLKSGFASSATTGVCGVLDVILDGPYYLDPDFFEANPGSRLTTRWDGTKVPVESVARAWWGNESTTYRSAKYVSTNISGGTATIGSDEDFGTISISSDYTRARHNGSNTALHTGYYGDAVATHGTPCMSQSYGKTHGWAYNANKWFISIIWADGAISDTILYEIQKVFHDLKPNRSSDNTKNPTVSSNSWGYSKPFYNGYYAYWRTSGDGTGEESITVTGSNPNYDVTSPQWLSYFWSDNSHAMWTRPTHSRMVEGASMLDSGVIFVASAGNNNNQLVKSDHANYDNYVSSSSSRTLSFAELNSEMVNRIPDPNCIGNLPNYNNEGVDIYRAFTIGALDDVQASNGDGSYFEYKVAYSNMGNAIDVFTIGDDSIGAQGGASNNFPRNDSTYRLDSNYNIVSSGGTLSLTSYDQRFGGTSSACPVTAGLFATKLQYERGWIWSNLKTWLKDKVTNQSSNTEFMAQTEATSSSSGWNTYFSLHGAERKILWDAPSSELTAKCELRGSNLLLTGTFTIS